MDGTVAAPADVDGLPERIEEPVAQRVADMRVVDATEPGSLARERRELRGGGERTRRVVQSGREPERTLLHRLPKEAAHPVERDVVRGHVIPTEGVDAQRGVAHQEAHVDAHLPVEPRR